MRIYISIDMEGLAGVAHARQVGARDGDAFYRLFVSLLRLAAVPSA